MSGSSLIDSDRVRPSVPPLVFEPGSFQPVQFSGSLAGDVPVQVYRRQRVLRAIGELSPTVVLPLGLSYVRQAASVNEAVDGQYLDDYTSVQWNTQGLHCRDPRKNAANKSYVHELSAARDMTLLSEVHGDDGVCQAWQRPRDCEAWFSPSAEYGVAGIGLVAKRSFLQSFLPVGAGSRWIEIWRGRIAKLELRGPRGRLDIWVV